MEYYCIILYNDAIGKINLYNIKYITFNTNDTNNITISMVDNSDTKWQFVAYKTSGGSKFILQKHISGASSWTTIWAVS